MFNLTNLAGCGDFIGAPWEISDFVYSGKSLDISGQGTYGSALFLSPDGSKLYSSNGDGGGTRGIYQYTLTIPFDLSSGAYASKSMSVATQLYAPPYAISFSSDGTKCYAGHESAATANTAYQYTLSTPWDISTGSYASKSLTMNQGGTTLRYFCLSADGSKAYGLGYTTKDIYQYTLSTPWDISTGSYASKSLNVSGQEFNPISFAFSDDGSKLYVIGQVDDTVYQYTLSTPWDISTGSYASKKLPVAAQDSSWLCSPVFGNNGVHFYLNGDTSDRVYQYTL